MSVKFVDMGEQQVKNIPSPIHAFTLSLGSIDGDVEEPPPKQPSKRGFGRWPVAASAAAAVSVLAALLYLTVAPTGRPAPLRTGRSVDPDKSCAQLSQMRSARTQESVNLTFSNKTDDEMSVIWLDFNGNQKLYRKLTPGQQYTQSTFQDHAWLVNDSKGRCIGIFRAGPTRTVELK